nr:uncharacterized protein LOC112721842 [Arachis hypogaea]
MANSSSHATTQDKGKGPVIAPPSPPALRILNQINDEIIDDPHLQRQYNVTFSTSYSEFIAYNMGADGTEITDNEHVAFFSFITKSCFEWWTAYYSRYTRTLEEIQQTAVRTAVTESLPKRTHKRKADATRPPPHKSRRTPTRTSRRLVLQSSSESADESEPTNKDSLAASSQSEDAADSDPSPQLILRSRVSQVIDLTANPLQHSPEETHRLESISPNNQAAFSEGNQVVPDSDSASKSADTTNSNSSRSKVLETPPELQPNPSLQANLQTPPGPRPGTSNVPTTPTSATLDDLIFVLNKVIQENKVPVPVPEISRPATSRPPIELDPDTREQLRSLIKLLDHPPTTWVNDPILNKLLADLLNSSFELPTNTLYSASIQEFKQLLNESVASQFQLQKTKNKEATARSNIENCLATAQPIQTSREEFDQRISHAISVQAFHDQEEARLEAEIIQIKEQLATIRRNRATIAKPLAVAQQEQHLLIQELVSIDTKRGEYEKQLEKIQADKFKQMEELSILENKRAKLRSDLAKLVAP